MGKQVVVVAKQGGYLTHAQGELVGSDLGNRYCSLTNARLTRPKEKYADGILTTAVTALALIGPAESMYVGPKVPNIDLCGVSHIIECSEEAAQAWLAYGAKREVVTP